MLKEHLQKHFNKIKTIQLKRHHYILGGLGIAAITVIASIFGFQNIGTHAAPRQPGTNPTVCNVVGDLSHYVELGHGGTVTIICQGDELLGSIPDGQLIYNRNVIEVRNQQTQNGSHSNERLYIFGFIGTHTGHSPFGINANVMGNNAVAMLTNGIEIYQEENLEANCNITINSNILYTNLGYATGNVTCSGVKESLTTGELTYNHSVIEITELGTEGEIQGMESQISSIKGDGGTAEYSLTFQYRGIGSGKTTIEITGDDVEYLGIATGVKTSEITVLEPYCLRDSVSKRSLMLNETGTASFRCYNVEQTIKSTDITNEGNILNVTNFDVTSIIEGNIISERGGENQGKGEEVGKIYTFTYEGVLTGTTKLTITGSNATTLGIQPIESKSITVTEIPNCTIKVSDTSLIIEETGTGSITCSNFTQNILESRISHGNAISIKNRDAGTPRGGTSTATFTYKGENTGNTKIEINETGMNAIGLDETVSSYTITVSDYPTCRFSLSNRYIQVNETGTGELICENYSDNLYEGFVEYGDEISITEWNFGTPKGGENSASFTYKGKSVGTTNIEITSLGLQTIGLQNNVQSESITVEHDIYTDCERPEPIEIDKNTSGTIVLTCDTGNLPLFELRNNITITTYSGNAPIITTGETKKAFGQTREQTIYNLTFTGTNTGNVKLTINGIMKNGSINYHFGNKTNGEITVKDTTPTTINTSCDWQADTVSIEAGQAGSIELTCNVKNLPVLNLRDIITYGTIRDIITTGEITKPFAQESDTTKFTINFTGNNSGYVKLNINGQLESGGVNYIFSDKNTGNIEIYESATPTGPDCTVTAEPSQVIRNQGGTITVQCTGEKMQLTGSLGNAIKTNDNLTVEEYPSQQTTGDTNIKLVYQFTGAQVGTSYVLLLENRINSNGTRNGIVTGNDIEVVDTPTPTYCSIEAIPYSGYVNETGNIIVTCEGTKYYDLTSQGLIYSGNIITVSYESDRQEDNNKTTFTFKFTGDNPGRSELKLIENAIGNAQNGSTSASFDTGITVNNPIPDCNTGWDNDYFITPEFRALNPTHAQIACALYGNNGEDETAYTMGWEDYKPGVTCSGFDEMNVVEVTTLESTVLTENTIYVLTSAGFEMNDTIKLPKCSAIISNRTNGKDTTIGFNSINSNGIQINENYGILDNLSLYDNNQNRNGIEILSGSSNTINMIKVYNRKINGIAIERGQYNKLNNIQVFGNKDIGIGIMDRSTKNTISNSQIYANDEEGISIAYSYENIIQNVEIYENRTGLYIMQGTENIFEDIELLNNWISNIYIQSGLVNEGTGNLQQYPVQKFFENSGEYNESERGTTKWKSEISGFDRVYSESEQMTFYTFNCEGGWTTGYLYTGNNPLNITGEAQTKCDLENRGYYMGEYVQDTIWGEYEIKNVTSMLGNEHTYQGYTYPDYITNPRMNNTHYFVWTSNNRNAITEKIRDYSYGYKINTQKDVKLRNNNEGGYVNTKNFIGSNVQKYEIGGTVNKHTKVHYTIEGTATDTGEIKKYNIYQIPQNIPSTIDWYIGSTRTKHTLINRINQLTNIDINSGVEIYIETGDTSSYPVIVQMYGEGGTGPERNDYFAEHRYIGALNRQAPTFEIQPGNMCTKEEIINMTGTWNGYEYNITGFDFDDIIVNGNAEKVENSFSAGSTTGVYTWQISLRGGEGTVKVNGNTAEDILEFGNSQTATRTYNRDIYAPRIDTEGFEIEECTRKLLDVDANDEGCAGISRYKLEGELGNIGRQSSRILRIDAETIGRTGGITKTGKLYVVDNFGNTGSRVITGTIININPRVYTGTSFDNPKVYGEITGPVSILNVINYLQAKEGECGTQDLKVVGVSCTNGTVGTVGNNNSVEITPSNNGETICSVTIEDNEHTTDTGYIKFTVKDLSSTEYSCSWTAPTPNQIKIAEEGQISLNCNGINFAELSAAEISSIKNQISASDETVLDYTISDTITINYEGNKTGETHFIFNGVALDGIRTLTSTNSNSIKVYIDIYTGCRRGEPTYDPIAVGVDAYIDLNCNGLQYDAENDRDVWRAIIYNPNGNADVINTGNAEVLTGKVRFHYSGAREGQVSLIASGDSYGYLYLSEGESNPIHVIANTPANGPTCSITGTEMVILGQTGTITVKCNGGAYGITTNALTNSDIVYSGNIIEIGNSNIINVAGNEKVFELTFTGTNTGITHLALNTGAVVNIPGIGNRYTTGNDIKIVNNEGIACQWKPQPNTIGIGETGMMELDCEILSYIREIRTYEELQNFLRLSGSSVTGHLDIIDGIHEMGVIYTGGEEEGVTQFAISGTIGNVHIQTNAYRSSGVTVTNDGIELHINPQEKISNQNITVDMSGRNANWVKYYTTGTASLDFNICKEYGTLLEENGGIFNGTETITNNEEGTKYIYLCGAQGSDRSGMEIGIYKIDTTKPECEITANPREWTNSGVILSVTNINELNPYLYSWTGFNEGDMSTTTGTKTVYTTGTYSFYMKDAAGNTGICSTGVTNIDTQGPTGTVTYINGNGEYGNSCTTGSVTIKLNTGESISGYPEKAFARNSTGNSAWTGNNTKTVTENESGTGYIRDNAGNILPIPYNVTGIVNEGPSEPILNSPENGNPISSSNREFNWIGSTPDNCATINGYTMYILSGTDIVRSGNTGGTSIVPISLPNGTYSRYVVATDNFGQTAQSETRTFEIINDMPECTITYEPPYTPGFWTNQNVIGTLTCTDPNVNIITGTNVFTGNGYLPFSVQDSSNNIRIITGHVDWIDKIAPECGTWTYDPEMTEWTNSGVIATLTGSTDDLSGFGTGGGSCTISGYGLTCNVTISDKAGNPKVCTSSGATNIDTQDPIFNVIIVDGDNLYECQTGTAEITYVSGGVSGLPTNAYIWNGITGNSTTYSQYSSIVDTQNITVSVIDNAGNITETGITFNWQDVELQIGNTNQSLGQLTGEKVINNVITDLNVTAGECESITLSITGHSHATCTLNGNKLTITPQGNYNGNGYCTIAFTDGDTTKTGKYTFTVNTIVDDLTLELDPAGSEWVGNPISVHMIATNTTGAKFLLTGESGISFDTCRNASNGGILVSESATPTIYEGTTTINTNGINYLYLCATSLTGQEEMISGIYKIDTEGFTGDVEYENVNGEIGNSCTTGNITIKLNTGESISGYPEKAFARNSTGNSAWTGNNTKIATENETGTGYIRDNAGHIISLPYNVTGIVNEEPTTPTLQNPGNGDTIPSSNTEFTWTESQPDNCATINGYTMYILSGTDIVRSGSTNGTGIIPISLQNGIYSRYVVVTDNFGQTAQSETRTIEINNNMPECSITYEPPYTQGFWTNQNVTGTLTCTDTGVNIITGTNVFTENGDLPFSVEDSSNNIRIITGHVTWIDKTPPYVSGHTNTTTGWYTGDLVYSFIYADTGAGISGEDTISCTISEEGTGQACSITGVNICDKVGNCNNKPVVSQAINLDKSNPICGTRSYNPGSGTLTTGDVEATLTGSYDTISQIDISGGSCTVTGYNQNCNVTISDNAGNTEVCTSENVTWIDTGAPILHEVTPIGTTTDTTPDYTFSSTEPGIITYSGACSSATTGAVSGNNTITLNQLAYGTYSGCTITVTDNLGHTSDVLTISTFTIRQGGGGGGGGLHKDNCPDGDYSDSYYDGTCEGPKDICGVSKSKYDTELKTAYLYAYTHKMTTMCPIEDANLYGVIRRDELAKMLTEYALEVLDLEPEAGKSGCTAYNDIANSSAEMKYYMKTACELNIMGLESDGKTPMKSFYPAGLVSRAEFGTTLSRLIYGDAYNLESEAENTYPGAWYGKHLEALKRDEIMTKIYGDRPQHLELRGYVMLMIMRHGKARLDNVKNVPYSTKEEILEIYNKNKALTCEVSYYESADEHGTGMIYVKDNKLRENYKIYREGNASALIKNNKLYVRGDAIGTGMGMVVDTETTALEELEALLEDETYTFKNCNEAVKNINAFELPSNVKFKTLGDWFTELSDSFTNLFD